MDVFDDSKKISKSFSHVRIDPKGWTKGNIFTPSGIVSTYAQGDNDSFHMTKLEFVHKNRMHIRTFMGKRYSPRAIVTKANQFVSDVLEGEDTP